MLKVNTVIIIVSAWHRRIFPFAGEILLFTTTRRKIPNIWGNWHSIPHLSCMMLNNGELKSCSINSPLWGIENFRCNIGMSILHQGVKEIGQIPHLSLVASHSWLMGNLFSPLRGEKSNPFFSSVKDWVNPNESHFFVVVEF